MPPKPTTSQTAPKPGKQILVLPKNLQGLGASNDFAPTKPEQLRIILEAESGNGKTTFIRSKPNMAILDFEQSCGNTVGGKATYFPIKTWADYEKVRDALIADAAAPKPAFNSVAFDTCDTFMRLIDKHLCDDLNEGRLKAKKPLLTTIFEYGADGAGYTKLTSYLLREIDKFASVGYPFVLTCHLRCRTTVYGKGQQSETVVQERRCSMPPSTMESLEKLVDLKGRIYRADDQVTKKVEKAIKVKGRPDIVTTQNVTKTVTKYFFGLTLGGGGNTERGKRRIPTFEGVVELPLIGGWDAVSDRYLKACKDASSLDRDNNPF